MKLAKAMSLCCKLRVHTPRPAKWYWGKGTWEQQLCRPSLLTFYFRTFLCIIPSLGSTLLSHTTCECLPNTACVKMSVF